MLDLRYCKRCNKIHKFGNVGMCLSCLKEYEQIMVKIREYLEENPMSGVMDISKDIDVSEKDILFLLREGRLSLRDESHKCLKCRKSINTGRYCMTCIKEMKSELKSVSDSIKGKPVKDNRMLDKGEMYTLYRRKEK